MKRKLSVQEAMRIAVIAFTITGLFGCTQPGTDVASQGSDVVLRTEIDNSGAHSAMPSVTHTAAFVSVDSIQVTSSAFVCSNFMLRSDTADSDPQDNLSEAFIRPEQFLLDFEASGRQYVGERIVYPITYNSARFDIHSVQGKADSLAQSLGSTYGSLFGGTLTSLPGATVVIRGVIYLAEAQVPFTYATNLVGAGRVMFDHPLNVSANGNPTEVIVKFRTANVFASSGGMLMDPRDARNAAMIDANLKTALRGSF